MFHVGGGYTARHLVNMLMPSSVQDPSPADVLSAALTELRDLRSAAAPQTKTSPTLIALRAVEHARAEFCREHGNDPKDRFSYVRVGDMDTLLSDILTVLSKHIQEGA